MSDATGRMIFAMLCLLAMIAITGGGVLELLRFKRGESMLRRGQLGLRLFSAFVWLILLGSLAYVASARKFAAVISGSLFLLFIAIFLLAYDVWQVGRQRRLQERTFQRNLEGFAREEIQKIQNDTSPSDGDDK
jgi:uncharacterized membrane protein YhaH (DUF805 family)